MIREHDALELGYEKLLQLLAKRRCLQILMISALDTAQRKNSLVGSGF